jgi:putative endonuclease
MKGENWEVYIIQARSGQLYTGITNDFDKRFAHHQTGKKGARFFRLSPPECVLYREKMDNRSQATIRELEIKRLTRAQKLELIKAAQD